MRLVPPPGQFAATRDVAWAKTEDEVRQLAQLQARFIDKSIGFLKPGGQIIYCTCSLQKAEGEDQIKAALARHDTLELVPITVPMVGGLKELITREGYMRALPSYLNDKGGMGRVFCCRAQGEIT